MTIDFDRIKSVHSLTDIVGRYVKWDKKSRGGDMWACCPFHKEKTASFHCDDKKAAYHCFGCGASGDVLDFIQAVENVDFGTAMRRLDGATYDASADAVEPRVIAKPEQTYVIMKPGSEEIEPGKKLKLWNPSRGRWSYVQPTMLFPYRERDGELIGYVIRLDLQNGDKITPMVSWIAKDDGEMCWSYAPFRKPRPLYGLDRLADDGDVWIAEGEKAADALWRLREGRSVVSWAGGKEGVKHANWTPLKGRSVVMWRDNDGPGLDAANDIAARCGASSFRIVGGETERKPGWDAADAEIEGWTPQDVDEWAEKWRDAPPQVREPEPEPEPKQFRTIEYPFRILGFNRDTYFYMPNGKQQLVALKAAEHTPKRLYQLAHMDYWENGWGDPGLSEKKWEQIANALINTSHGEGIFEETRIRGRGAWIDMGRTIVHTGSEAHVGAETMPVAKVPSRFIYEAAPPWEFGYGKAAKSSEAHRLVQICDRLTWTNKMSGAILAGWCVIAPISGALNWRPHIWITGPSGSGKTTAQNDIVGRIVGPAAERFDGKTTEAAIRQKLGFDARPVIIDEVEAEDTNGAKRVQGILDLMRVASSGGVITKGSSNHRSIDFVTRSCFCLSSINTSIHHRADESRITMLMLMPNARLDRENHYEGLMADINAWFTTEFASALFVRTVENIGTLLKNIKVFTDAAAIVFKNRRAADQIGAMLAGFYLCHNTREVTLAEAREFILARNWDDHVTTNGAPDEDRLFQFLMTRKIRVIGNGVNTEVTIGQACEEARMEQGDRKKPYTAALGSVGIRSVEEEIFISTTAATTRDLFREETKWQADWARWLNMLPGASTTRGGVYFVSGLNTRATILPFGLLDGSFREREPGEEEF